MNPRNTHHIDTPNLRNSNETEALRNTASLRNDDGFLESDEYVDSGDYIEKVAAILESLGAERLPAINMYDVVAHLSYRDIFFTELSIAVGDYTGPDVNDDDSANADADDEFVIEVGAVLAFGDTVDKGAWNNALGVLDESVEPLRDLISGPAFIEVSDQGEFNVWLILPLTEAAVESDGITDTLTQYLNTAIGLHNELRNRLENGR